MGELRGQRKHRGRGRSLPGAVAERIQVGILGGRLRAGDRLPPERELAEELGVNRSSLREALKKLEELRLVEIHRGSGTWVRDADHASFEVVSAMSFAEGRPNLPWIRDVLELREVFVPALVRRLIESTPPDRLDSAAALLRGTASPELTDREFLESLHAVPATLCELGGNRVALLLANSVDRSLSRAGMHLMGSLRAPERRSLRPVLQRLAVAFEARDADSAERCARELMRRLSAQTLKYLGRVAEPAGPEVDPPSPPG